MWVREIHTQTYMCTNVTGHILFVGPCSEHIRSCHPHSCSPPSALAVPKVMQIFVKDVTTLAFDVEDGCTVEQLKMRFTQRAFGVDAAASWVSRVPSHAVLQRGPLRQLRWLHAASGPLPEWAQPSCARARCMPSAQLLCTCLQGRIRPSTTLYRPSLSISLSLFCC